MWYVYILQCSNGALYTGITKDIARRFNEHIAGRGGKFTRSFLPEKILFTERHLSKESALAREALIKKWPRKKKLELIKSRQRAPCVMYGESDTTRQ
jgi:putative endonuclease